MRITNTMISNHSKNNVNANKLLVDKYNTQMTTQKKISKPSEAPVIAIRSLRLATNLSQLNQFADNNIPDAEAWLDITETALQNMKDIVTDIRTQCVYGATDSLTETDRKTILENLSALSDQIYAEGNADYAGRTVFTGYRTSDRLTFRTDEPDRTYQIDENFTYEDFETYRYYSGNVTVPADATTECNEEIVEHDYYRLRTGYDELDSVDSFEVLDGDGNEMTGITLRYYDTIEAWESEGMNVEDGEVVVLRDSGEFVFGEDLYKSLKSEKATFRTTYTKTGFQSGEIMPEYLYNCRDISDPANPVEYEKTDQKIEYTIAANTKLTVNTQASDVFDTSIARDVNEMVNIVNRAINAHQKVEDITAMMKEARYQDEESQANLKTYLDAAQKEADYADDNLQKTFGQFITNFDNYLADINLSITNVGSTMDRLAMTQTRVENQQDTIEGLKSKNEDRDMSDIIIDYYTSYNAYTASLTATAKIGQETLLNYL